MAKAATRTMSAQHKAALAEGRSEGRAVKNYLEALAAEPPAAGPAAHARFHQEAPRRHRRRRYGDVSALQQLQLVQERMDLQKELEAMGTKVDLSALESDFVKTASKYAAAQGHLLRGVA